MNRSILANIMVIAGTTAICVGCFYVSMSAGLVVSGMLAITLGVSIISDTRRKQ